MKYKMTWLKGEYDGEVEVKVEGSNVRVEEVASSPSHNLFNEGVWEFLSHAVAQEAARKIVAGKMSLNRIAEKYGNPQ